MYIFYMLLWLYITKIGKVTEKEKVAIELPCKNDI